MQWYRLTKEIWCKDMDYGKKWHIPTAKPSYHPSPEGYTALCGKEILIDVSLSGPYVQNLDNLSYLKCKKCEKKL